MTIAMTAQPSPQPNSQPSAQEDINLLNRTKIVATLGPATASPEMVKRLAKAGVSVFRLNMSHGNAHEQGPKVEMIRQVARELDQPLAILADLQGPKLR